MREPASILLVDDDHIQLEGLIARLEHELAMGPVSIISTESGFRSALQGIQDLPPDLIIMDMMLRWADPGPAIPQPPSDVAEEGFYRAGLRCIRLLRLSPRTDAVPVVLYTVLQREDVVQDLQSLGLVFFLQKRSDDTELVQLCRAVLQARGRAGWRPGSEQETMLRLGAAVCVRGHVVADGLVNAPTEPVERFCPSCGGPVSRVCSGCGAPIAGRRSNSRALALPEQFCAHCGIPHPWATREARVLHLENLLQYEDLEEETQLLLIEELAVLGAPLGDVNEDRRLEAGATIKRSAPKLWELGRPVLQTLLTEAGRRVLQL